MIDAPSSLINNGGDDVSEGMKSLVNMLRLLFIGLRVLMVVVFVCLIFSGVFYVKQDEEAMLFRFGKLVSKDGSQLLTSGNWYWAWPYPIDQVVRIPAHRSITLSTRQFLPQRTSGLLHDTAAASPEQQPLRPGEAGYLLTGDANIMHSAWTVTYRVTNAQKYYLKYYGAAEAAARDRSDNRRRNEAVEMIRSALEETVLKEVARWPVESVLVASRSQTDAELQPLPLQRAVRSRLGATLDKLDIGIEVQQVSLISIFAPQATQPAFNEVVAAAQEYQRQIDNAQAYEKSVITEAEGKRARIHSESMAYQTRAVESVKAEKAYFQQVLKEYQLNPRTMLVALYTDTISEVLNNVGTKYVIHSRPDQRQEIRLLLGPEAEVPPAKRQVER